MQACVPTNPETSNNLRNLYPEIATNFKTQGNDCYKQKDYRNAIQYYNKGLQAKSDDRKLNATLLCNRAAVNLDLGMILCFTSHIPPQEF